MVTLVVTEEYETIQVEKRCKPGWWAYWADALVLPGLFAGAMDRGSEESMFANCHESRSTIGSQQEELTQDVIRRVPIPDAVVCACPTGTTLRSCATTSADGSASIDVSPWWRSYRPGGTTEVAFSDQGGAVLKRLPVATALFLPPELGRDWDTAARATAPDRDRLEAVKRLLAAGVLSPEEAAQRQREILR